MNCDISAIWKMMSYSGIKLHTIEEMQYNAQSNCVHIFDGDKWFKVVIMMEGLA
tara:strand:- start:6141 stop:6302 length:162 start_codon:yes stop_codon:yes gene_type:complete